ncbi:hypothetical protein CXX78_01575 [Candidatus Parvarchaeota archaeon]|nr:MAG: hypothetical protein CXX78_01575 [Candidatus Parvarchaeota archaeon]
MQEYYFLFTVAFVWIIFAVFQDLKTREISNWLNFSLIAFVLAYRAFYSIYSKDISFFLYGLGGIFLFVLLGFLFYYSRIFAGGDAKLLMGLGGVLPFESLSDYLVIGGGFIFLFFLVGVTYTLAYSLFLVLKNKKSFVKEFDKEFAASKNWFYLIIGSLIISGIVAKNLALQNLFYLFLFLFILFLLLIYTRALEKSCMIKKISPNNLTEGDWLEEDVKVNGKIIKKNVHGLSFKEIEMLKKAKKKVWIKEGVPFSPTFLLAMIVFSLGYFPI